MKQSWPSFRLIFYAVCLGLGLALLSSCATGNAVRRVLPPETSFNPEAGRGGLILVNVRLASGEELPFIVDTGSPFVLVDKSLEPGLGKPLQHYDMHSIFGVSHTHLYQSPQLTLGNVPLTIGATVCTMDCSLLSKNLNDSGHSHYRIMGVLGMECLRHYCLQLDFTDHKLRFLDSRQLDLQKLGEAFPLRPFQSIFVAAQGNLRGDPHAASFVDTGMTFDGDVSSKPWEQQAFFQKYRSKDLIITNGIFGGYTYSNLCLGNGRADVLGLGFLSRNLVTFDFPNRRMYLKPERTGNYSSDVQ